MIQKYFLCNVRIPKTIDKFYNYLIIAAIIYMVYRIGIRIRILETRVDGH